MAPSVSEGTSFHRPPNFTCLAIASEFGDVGDEKAARDNLVRAGNSRALGPPPAGAGGAASSSLRTAVPLSPPLAQARAEYEVFVRFSELTQGKMAVIISHRFSTVRMAEHIVVLKHGEIIEQGSHDELLAGNGLYAELFNLQAAGYR